MSEKALLPAKHIFCEQCPCGSAQLHRTTRPPAQWNHISCTYNIPKHWKSM